MAIEIPPKIHGESNDDYLKRLIDIYNANPLVGILFKRKSFEEERAKKKGRDG